MNRTIPWLFRTAVEDVPDKTWLLAGDDAFTYRESLDRVERAAAWFRGAGIGSQDRVLVTARNTPAYLFSWLALMEVGAIQVPLNPASTAVELAGFVRQVSPKLIVSDPELRPALQAARTLAGSTAAAADVGEIFEAPADGRGPAEIAPADVAVMIPTSGTTGRSKLVMQTHLAYVMAGEGFGYWLHLTSDDRLMTSLPLFHINAPAYSTLGSVAARASLVLLPGFSAGGFIDSARRYGATEFNSIGAMIEILMRQPPKADDADNPVRICYTGPSPSRERQLEIEERFGFEIICGYAMSETPYGLVWRHGTRPFGTLGSARQHPVLGHVNDARVVDKGVQVANGQVGELELRNPAIMRGYYEMPEETAAVLADGWLRTGDLVADNGDGTYTFVGRKKQIIRRRGENLSPTEVEAVLERHPDVAAAAVIGVASELSDEDVKAFVSPSPGRTIDVAQLHAFAAEHLAPYKVPRYIEVVDELAHTATGRVAKHLLAVGRTPGEVDFEVRPLNPKQRPVSPERRPVNPEQRPVSPERRPVSAEHEPEVASQGKEYLRTWIGSTTSDTISVAGRDLATELMGRLTLTELSYLLITHREPTGGERRMLDAVLVSLADHGLTPSALAARLTYTGAPEAVQGAVAAGLLGAGSVFLGPAGDTAEFLAYALQDQAAVPAEADLRRVAARAVEARRGGGLRVPGLGHPVHRMQDPRTSRIYQLAIEVGLLGPHLRLLRLVAEVHEELTGRRLPINGAGAGGAALVDAGLPPTSVRGFVLIARTAGLVAHLAEEVGRPVGMPLWLEVERRAREAYDPPS